MGGTESTILRIAEGLAARGYRISVAQGGRSTVEISESGARYLPLNWRDLAENFYQEIILLNTPKLLKGCRRLWPQANIKLWIHCFPGKRRRKMLNKLAVNANAELLAVSDTLRRTLQNHLQKFKTYGSKPNQPTQLARVRRVYNPIADELQSDSTPVDINKLVFFSSPHKGLAQVLKVFEGIKKVLPDLQLYIANPGYVPLPKNLSRKDINILGALSQKEVIQHVREALCVFYPQDFFKETFGLVFAEANAVGTPVLTSAVGAAPEVLENKQQILDVRNITEVAVTIAKWQAGRRPIVQLPTKFRTRQVLNHWEKLLAGLQPVDRLPVEKDRAELAKEYESR
jgi:glycosyltransferase involved in cell wall biosynthesis